MIAGVAAGIAISLATPGHTEPYDGIFQAMIFATAWAAGVLNRTKRASLEAAQSRAERAEAELDRHATRAAAAERARIARELHDVVAHHVSLMAVQAEAAASLLPGQPVQARPLGGDHRRHGPAGPDRAAPAARRAARPVRAAGDGSVGVARRDRRACSTRCAAPGLPVDFEVVGTPGPLAPGVDLTAYRIVQEALTNTIRHARAARAAVTLSYEPGYITVSVTDSGPALDGLPRGNGSAAPGQAAARGVRARPGRDRRAGRLVRRQPHGRPDPGRRLRRHRPAAGAMTAPAAPAPIRVLVVDDQELVRAGFCVILDAADGITVVGEAANGEAAVAGRRRTSPTWC